MKSAFSIVFAISFGAFAAGLAAKANDAAHADDAPRIADKAVQKAPVKIKADASRQASYD